MQIDKLHIAEQKLVADKALDMLFPVSPYAIVAGGAPVDWYLGNKARDIDIFINLDNRLSNRDVVMILKRIGFDNVNTIGNEEAENINYTMNPDIDHVYDCKLDDMNIQIIRLKCNTHDIVNKFVFNVNKAWYKNLCMHIEDSCKYGLAKRVIIREGKIYANTLRYRDKIQKKFKGFRYFDSPMDFLNRGLYRE